MACWIIRIFTRPEQLEGYSVPDVLLSGNHADIDRWRMKQALGRTWHKTPDLLKKQEFKCRAGISAANN